MQVMDRQSPLDPEGLQARLEALRPGLEVLAMPACILDRQQRYRFVNAAYCDYAGVPASEFLGRIAAEVFKRQPEDSRRQQLARALAGEPVIYNRQNIEGPNRGKWVRAHYLPLHEREQVIGV